MSSLKHQYIISQLTLAEKAALLSGKDYWQSQDAPRLGIGSMFLADGPHGIRKQAVSSEQPGLNKGIPATCFPTAATVANSWNEELGELVGRYLGEEAVSQKVNVLLGPGINIKRNPRCGRNFEYFSEDPYLTGKMAAAYIRGIQSHGISACVKHFAAENQETSSMSIDVVVDERTLREIYLTAFEMAVTEGQTRALMTAYNKINGTYAGENRHLMYDILRQEWGYQGCVITNWGGSTDRIAELKAGLDLAMPRIPGEENDRLLQAVEAGELSEDEIDRSLDRILDLALTTEAVYSIPRLDFNVSQHHRVSQRVAEESIVLLRNEGGILPLKFGAKTAVIGDFAKNARYQGAGSSIVNPTVLDNTLECFEESGIKSIGYEPGFRRYGQKSRRLIRKGVALAAEADVVLLYLGLDEVSEAQGVDRPTMALPKNQTDLLDAIYEVNRNIIVILSCGSAVEMPWIGKVRGLLHTYLGGQAGARAILRVISGDVNPSGKLAESYPLRYEDVPGAAYFPGREATVEYREGLFVGYRYYDSVGKDVLFPFGFGLSYTTFSYADIAVDAQGVSFTLRNSGDRPGMEVSQLYVGGPSSGLFRCRSELKGFAKTFINPGESKRVTIPFDDKTFRYFNVATRRWEIEEGPYQIMIGASSRDIRLKAVKTLAGTGAPLPYGGEDLSSYRNAEVKDVPDAEFERLLGRPLPAACWDRKRPLTYDDSIAQCRYARGIAARLFYHTVLLARRILRRIGKRSLANMLMMSVYNMTFRGIARMTGGIVNLPMVDALLMMANGRFFKGLRHLLRERRRHRRYRKNQA